MGQFFCTYIVLRNVPNQALCGQASAFGLSVHSFVSYERIGKRDEERYRKGGRKPYFIELGGIPRWINLYAVADADVYYNYEA